MILCPKCGKVKEYGIKEYVHRVGIYNEDNKIIDTTEDIGFRFGQPRCLKCNSIVKFYVEPEDFDFDFDKVKEILKKDNLDNLIVDHSCGK